VHAYRGGATVTREQDDPTLKILGQLADEIAPLAPRGAEFVSSRWVRRGAPWVKILNVATECGADLVAVGGPTGQRGSEAGFPFVWSHRAVSLRSSARSVLVARPG